MRSGFEFEELYATLANKHLCVDREDSILRCIVGWLKLSAEGKRASEEQI